jgi:hypothetical protein
MLDVSSSHEDSKFLVQVVAAVLVKSLMFCHSLAHTWCYQSSSHYVVIEMDML